MSRNKGKEHNARRTAWLALQGFRVIRFRNQALDEGILGSGGGGLTGLRGTPSPALNSMGGGAGKTTIRPAQGREPEGREFAIPPRSRKDQE